jgi:hypothetical protein
MFPQQNVATGNASTGPRTPEGRARSSQNSLRHGLSGRKYKIVLDERPEFERHMNDMMAALAPEGAIELQLAEAIILDQYRLARARDLENEIFLKGTIEAPNDLIPGAETWERFGKNLALLTLYEQRINRVLTRNKAEFETRQAARKAADAPLTDPLRTSAPAHGGFGMPMNSRAGAAAASPGGLQSPAHPESPEAADSKPANLAATVPVPTPEFVCSNLAQAPVAATQMPHLIPDSWPRASGADPEVVIAA